MSSLLSFKCHYTNLAHHELSIAVMDKGRAFFLWDPLRCLISCATGLNRSQDVSDIPLAKKKDVSDIQNKISRLANWAQTKRSPLIREQDQRGPWSDGGPASETIRILSSQQMKRTKRSCCRRCGRDLSLVGFGLRVLGFTSSAG
jgi:hypothetical protein